MRIGDHRINDAGFVEAFGAEQAGVAFVAGTALGRGVVAAVG
jgi:hypothetical protein